MLDEDRRLDSNSSNGDEFTDNNDANVGGETYESPYESEELENKEPRLEENSFDESNIEMPDNEDNIYGNGNDEDNFVEDSFDTSSGEDFETIVEEEEKPKGFFSKIFKKKTQENNSMGVKVKNKGKYNFTKNKPMLFLCGGLLGIAFIIIFMWQSYKSDASVKAKIESSEVKDGFQKSVIDDDNTLFKSTTENKLDESLDIQENSNKDKPVAPVQDENLNITDTNTSNDELNNLGQTFGDDQIANTGTKEVAKSVMGIYKGTVTDRVDYITAVSQKDAKLQKQFGINAYNSVKGNYYTSGQHGVSSYSNSNGLSNRLSNGQPRNIYLSGIGIQNGNQKFDKDLPKDSVWATTPDGDKGGQGKNPNGKTVSSPQYSRNSSNRANGSGEPIKASRYNVEQGYGRLNEGSIIPAILFNEINSDFPSRVGAYVREDVYDSLTGEKLLIPKGSKLYGDVLPLNANNGFSGVEKVITIWDKLYLPNGDVINLTDFRGVDLDGIDGISGKVNRRIMLKLSTAVLSGIFEGTTNLINTIPDLLAKTYLHKIGADTNKASGDDPRAEAVKKIGASGGAGASEGTAKVSETVGALTSGILARPNTVRLSKGTRFTIVINTPIDLTQYVQNR